MKIVSTRSTDGILLKGLHSESSNPKGVIINIHGMAGSVLLNSFYPVMHEKYPANSWDFIAGENRGAGVITDFIKEGGDVTIGNAFEIFEECVHDIKGWINYAKDLGFNRIWLQGHSLGCSKIAYYMNQTQDPNIEGLILLSPADMVGLVNSEEDSEDHKLLLAEALELQEAGKEDTLLSRNLWGYAKLSAKSYINLFGEDAKDAIFNFQDQGLGWDVVNSIKVPVISFTGTEDDGIKPVMNPKISMELLKKQLTNSQKKESVVFENGDHDFQGYSDEIVNHVLNFIG